MLYCLTCGWENSGLKLVHIGFEPCSEHFVTFCIVKNAWSVLYCLTCRWENTGLKLVLSGFEPCSEHSVLLKNLIDLCLQQRV